MAWATIALARLFSGLTTSDISDVDLTTLITYADKKTKECVFLTHTNASMDGGIDGSNTEFRIPYYPIADYDTSGTVDASDVTVYLVKSDSSTGFDESTVATVSTVNARDGIITLDTAPSSTTADSVVADYWSTKLGLDTDKLAYISSLALAWLAFQNIAGSKGLDPDSYSWDGFRVTKSNALDKVVKKANGVLMEFKQECISAKPGRAMFRNDNHGVAMTDWLSNRETA